MGQDTRITVNGEQPREPFVEAEHPVTGEALLFHDPYYEPVAPAINLLQCEDAASFAAAVIAVAGANNLVEFGPESSFTYRNELGGICTRTVRFGLQAPPTRKVLCLTGELSFVQRALAQWVEQYPGTLVPEDDQPEAVYEEIAAFKATGSKNVAISQGDSTISVAVEKSDGSENTRIPRFWKGRSAVYTDHEEFDVRLRLDIEQPEVDIATGQVTGVLKFHFSLWTPDSTTIMNAAKADAVKRVGDLLPDDFTIIRGCIH